VTEVQPLLAAVVALLVPALLGRQVVRALSGPALGDALGRAGEGAFGFGVGLTLVSVALGLAYVARAPAPGPIVAAAALAGWAWLAWRARGRGVPASAGTLGPPRSALARAGLLAGWLLLAALVAAVAVASWRAAAGFPDAHQVWLLRGKVLYVDQGFGGSYFQSWHSAHDNRAYPPLVSLATAWMHEVGRDADARAAKLLSAAFFAALLAVAHGALRRSLPRGTALALTLALAGCNTLVMLGIWGIADLPLAFHVLCAGVLLLAVDDPRALVRLLAFPVAGAVLTKNEGLPVALAVAAALGLRLLCERGTGSVAGGGRRFVRAVGSAAAVLVPGALAVGAWWALCASLGLPLQFTKPVGGEELAPDRLAHAGLVLRDMVARLAEPSWLPGWIAFGVVVAVLAGRALRSGTSRGAMAREDEGPRCLAAATIVVLVAVAYAWVLAGYTGDLPYLLRISTSRLVAHGYPLAMVVAASGTAALARRRRPGQQE
jgi:hypothetical protein